METKNSFSRTWGVGHDSSLSGQEPLKIRVVRTDSGGECEKEFASEWERLHMHHEHPLLNDPRSNARAEGLNRQAIEGTTASMVQAGTPYQW